MGLLEFFTDSTKRRYTIKIFIVAFVLFYNSASAMYLYSFLPYMMVDFGVAKNETLSGKYAAWMAAGYFFARFLSSPFWGGFIDRQGRKKGLIIVLTTVSTLTLLFGLAQNYWWALCIRLLTGFINGLSIIGKVLTTEVCPEEMKAWSISVISTLWSLGMTVGPFFGSFFYGWIPDWPYLASAIAVALFGYILVLLSWIYLDETLDEDQKKPKPNVVPMKEVSYKSLKEEEETTHEHEDSEDQSNKNIKEKDGKSTTEENEEENTEKEIVITKIRQTSTQEFASMNRWQQFKYLLNIPNVIPLIFVFSINTFYAAVYGELIPFWGAAKRVDGGLDFTNADISQLFVYLTGPQLFIQLFLYPFLQKLKGDFWLLTMGHWMHIPVFILIPYAHLFPENGVFLIKCYLVFWMFIRNLGSFMNFSALQRYTNDTISPERRGQINGFQIAFSSLLQTCGPLLGGYVLSWSMETSRPYPFNYHFVFLIMVVITLITLYVIYNLDFVDKERKRLRGEGGLTS